MPQYCDSNRLEKNWFHWLLSSSVPLLEPYRIKGLLWTKIVGKALDGDGKPIVKSGKTLPNAMYPRRLHCIATASPIFFESNAGEIPTEGELHHEDQLIPYPLPQIDELSILSDSRIHCLRGNIFQQYDEVIPKLQMDGYIIEKPTEEMWHAMLLDVNKMCQGIAMKFNLPTEEEMIDFANEALLQVTNKFNKKKLVYTPGRAPVFNLLTTTIHRCMFSIMNKRKQQKNNLHKLMDDMRSGSLPDSHHSFQLQSTHRPIRAK